jgi:transposase
MAKRKQYSPELKTRVALAAIRGDGTIAELAQKYSVHPNMIAKWKREAVDGMKESFNRKGKKKLSPDNEIKTLQAKIGELVVERDFLARAFDQ